MKKYTFPETYKGQALKRSPIDFTKFILAWKRKLSLMDYMNEHFHVMVPLGHCILTTLPWTSFRVLQDLSPSTNSAGLVEYALLTSFVLWIIWSRPWTYMPALLCVVVFTWMDNWIHWVQQRIKLVTWEGREDILPGSLQDRLLGAMCHSSALPKRDHCIMLNSRSIRWSLIAFPETTISSHYKDVIP